VVSPKRIVICGGGAIGAAIAYFISIRGARPIIIERYEVGGAASGKSGGFLALDWCQGTPLDRLARRSFALHARLSSDLGDPWGYRRLTTYSGYAAAADSARSMGGRPWLSAGVTITGQIGSAESTAAVEPRAFTTGLMRAARVRGAVLRNGTVIDLVRGQSGAVCGVALAAGDVL
jgi:glycine/D-amino acid oxidase-like deaminating enzyme